MVAAWASSTPAWARSASPPATASTTPAAGPVPAKFTPTSATFISAATGWVLGRAPCTHTPCTSILRTRDGGATWRSIPAPRAPVGSPSVPNSGQVSILRFANKTDGWAAGGALYSTHDGGATWHRQHIGVAGSVVTSLETGGGHVYAVTYSCRTKTGVSCTARTVVYASPTGRDHWTAVSPRLSATFLGDAVIVVHGADWFVPGEKVIWHGHGTSKATPVANPCPIGGSATFALARLAVADATHLDAACAGDGGAGSASYQYYGTTDGARHWRPAGPAHRQPSDLTGLADNGHGVLVAAAASGDSELLRSTNDAVTFHHALVTAATGGTPWTDLGFTTTTRALAVLPGAALYLSHNAARTWSKVRF